MHSVKLYAFSLLVLALGSLLGGCSVQSPRDSSMPWSKPADWEGEVPGMNPNGMGGMGPH